MARFSRYQEGLTDGSRHYRRGAVMGLTAAEAFILLAFVLLMLLMLWRAENEDEMRTLREFADLGIEEQDELRALAAQFGNGGLPAAALRDRLSVFLDIQESEAGQAVVAAIAAAPEEERRRLVELIAGEEALKARIRERIAGEDAARATVAAALRDELGAVVAARGGEIAADGALVFPDKVLFAVGSAAITPELEAFLGEICLPWFRTLERADVEISELRIEGHASSEWDRATPPERAYLNNLALSQARAHAVLSTCLALVPGADGEWARQRATAIGFSSSRPVLVDGAEDPVRSRRVVFSVAFSRDTLIEAIEDEVAPAPADPTAGLEPLPEDRTGAVPIAPRDHAARALPEQEEAGRLAGPARVIDADTLDIGGTRIRLHGIDAPEGNQVCRNAEGWEYACGDHATAAMIRMVDGQEVLCEERDIDRYGRVVAVCRVEGTDINAALVSAGWALAYRRYSEDYVAEEEHARAQGAGLWAGEFDPPWDWRR